MIADTLLAPSGAWARAASPLKRWWGGLGDLFEAERERWLIWTPVLLGLGAALYFSLKTEPRLSQGVLLFGSVVALTVALRRRPALARTGAALAMVAGGFLAAQLRTAMVAAPVLHSAIGPVLVTGRVVDVELLEKGARVRLGDLTIGGAGSVATPQQVRISLTRYSAIPALGETITVKAKLFAPPSPASPGAHDFRRDLFYERIGAVGYAVRRFVEPARAQPQTGPPLGRLRQVAAERISAALSGPDEAPERAIALALLVGERGPIPDSVNGAMRDAGLAHLLAISGMNITIAAGLIYFTVRLALAAIPWIALRFAIKKWAAACGLAGAVLYTEFVGAPVSAERSMVTTGLVMLAIMLDRSALTLRLVAISASVLILIEPEALMGPSFQMSYGAIVALVVFYERWRLPAHGGGALRRIGLYLAGIALMSVVASAASAVFAIYHFQQSAFYGLGANLIAVPIHDLWIMPFGIASYALMPFGLEALALTPMGWGIRGMLATARLFAGFPGAAGHFEAMPISALALIVCGGLWFLLWSERWRWLGVAPVAGGIALTLLARQPDVLVADDGRLVALRLASGEIAVSNRQHDRFTQAVWVRRDGEGEIEDHPPPSLAGLSEPGGCGNGMCRFVVNGRTTVIVSDAKGLAAGCADADLVISQVAAHGVCQAKIVVDATDLARDGAYAITMMRHGAEIATVRALTGERPWTEPAERAPEPEVKRTKAGWGKTSDGDAVRHTAPPPSP